MRTTELFRDRTPGIARHSRDGHPRSARNTSILRPSAIANDKIEAPPLEGRLPFIPRDALDIQTIDEFIDCKAIPCGEF